MSTRRHRSEKAMIIVMMVASLGLLTAAVRNFVVAKPLDESMLLDVPARAVMGDARRCEGPESAPYTLVVFGDYECPPSRGADAQVAELLKTSGSRLRFTFRHLPLSRIHPLAYQSALLAETARKRGKFWPVHRALMRSDLTEATIVSIAHEYGLHLPAEGPDRSAVREIIEGDLQAAARLRIDSTPSFLLCGPNGQVQRFLSAADVAQHLGLSRVAQSGSRYMAQGGGIPNE